jgi:hypothetical protein
MEVEETVFSIELCEMLIDLDMLLCQNFKVNFRAYVPHFLNHLKSDMPIKSVFHFQS